MTWYGICIIISGILLVLATVLGCAAAAKDNTLGKLICTVILVFGALLLIIAIQCGPQEQIYYDADYDLPRFAADLEEQGYTVERITKTVRYTQMKEVADYIYRDDNWFTGPTNTWRYVHYEPKNAPIEMEQYRR